MASDPDQTLNQIVRKLFLTVNFIEFDEMVEYQSVKQNEYEVAVYNTSSRKLKFFKAEKKGFVEVFLEGKKNQGDVKVIKVVQMNGDANKDIVIAFCNTQVTAIDMNQKKCIKNEEGNYANVQLIENYLYTMQNEQHKK